VEEGAAQLAFAHRTRDAVEDGMFLAA